MFDYNFNYISNILLPFFIVDNHLFANSCMISSIPI